MDLESKNFALDVKNVADLSFEGYASVFDARDQSGDIVTKGAFAKSLATNRKVVMLWNHDPSDPIGVWDEVREDAKGLYVKGRLISGVPRADATAQLLKSDAISGMSIGYRTKMAEKGQNGARMLKEVELWEISLVTFPMLMEAQVSEVKSIKEPDIEARLLTAGFSVEQAEALMADGYKGLTGEAAAERAQASEFSDLLAAIHAAT